MHANLSRAAEMWQILTSSGFNAVEFKIEKRGAEASLVVEQETSLSENQRRHGWNAQHFGRELKLFG